MNIKKGDKVYYKVPTDKRLYGADSYTRSHDEYCYYNFETKDVKDNVYNDKEEDRLRDMGYVDIDMSIFPAIKTLNDKGYKTDYCCGGHFATYDLYFEDDISKLDLSLYERDDENEPLLHFLSYIAIDELYISFDFTGMSDNKRVKAISNMMPYIVRSDQLCFIKSFNNWIEFESKTGDRIYNSDLVFKLYNDFYDNTLFVRGQENLDKFKDNWKTVPREEIVMYMRDQVKRARDDFEVWAMQTRHYIDFMANDIKPIN